MSKFNTAAETMKTVNHGGLLAYRMDWKTELVTQVLTSFFNEQKFYGDNSEELTNILKSGIADDPEFVSRLAIFARNEFNMRSVSHVILCYLANISTGKPFVKRTLKHIVKRGDDATEILACYLNIFGKPIPNSLRKGLRDIFTAFDEYTLAKYKGTENVVKMRDILCLCHPTPKDQKQSDIWKALLENRLTPPYTWEVELSTKGNKKETWEELIDSGNVGYMALLRNLRNILNVEPKNIDKVFSKIADPVAVRQSRQLPFRYLSAYRNLPYGDTWDVLNAQTALERAAEVSVENLPRIPGKTIIAIDVSGSMSCPVSARSTVSCGDISCLLGVIADKICDQAMVFTFDDRLSRINIPKRNGILSSALAIDQSGGGTNMYLPFDHILEKKIYADRVIVLSDNECNCTFGEYDRAWHNWYSRGRTTSVQGVVDKYREEVNPNLWVHAVDLQGYGTQQFIGKNTNVIAGWSEKVFEFIRIAEEGIGSMVKKISEYNPLWS